MNTNILVKKFQASDCIEDATKLPTYKTENNLVFSEPEQVLVNRILHGKFEEYDITKDERANFLDIKAYQGGQFT